MHQTRTATTAARRQAPLGRQERPVVCEPLETRRLLSAGQAPSYIAILDTHQNNNDTKRSVSFYDVSDLSTGDQFDRLPMFSIWTGYEDTMSANFEDPGAITVNPFNGDVYVLAYDSIGSGEAMGSADSSGDTIGDFDLYRLDFQKALDAFRQNDLPRGTMFAPTVTPDGMSFNVVHPDHGGSTVFVEGVSEKIGEIARAQGSGFFDYDIEFVSPERLIILDNYSDGDDIPANDHQIRLVERISTAPGAATYDPATNTGGWNRHTTESWVSHIGGLVNMDLDSRSEPTDITYVSRDGIEGIWINDNDGPSDDGGDFHAQIAFFEVDWAAGTATPREQQVGAAPYPTSFSLDEDPTLDASSNDGDFDWINTDAAGNLLIGESGFHAPRHEPKVIGREIASYAAGDLDANGRGEISFGAWSSTGPMPSPTLDDDGATDVNDASTITDSRFVTYDRGSDTVWYFDLDSDGTSTFHPWENADVYAFNRTTGQLVYQELDAINHFIERHGIRFFTPGDATGDGLVDTADIDRLYAHIAEAEDVATPPARAALLGEWFDLDGDGILTVGMPTTVRQLNGDMDVLIRRVLGTEYGDLNLDGRIDSSDFFAANIGMRFGRSGYANGDINGDGVIDASDFALINVMARFNPTPIRI